MSAGLEGPDGTILCVAAVVGCWLLALVTSILLHEGFRAPGGRTHFRMWRLQVSLLSQQRWKLPGVLRLGLGAHTVPPLASPISESKSRGQLKFSSTLWQGNNGEFLPMFNLMQWAVKPWTRDLTSLCLAFPPL